MDGDFNSKKWSDWVYIQRIWQAIAVWRAETPSVISKTLANVTAPITWLIQKIIPQAAIEGVLSGLDWCVKHNLKPQGAANPNNLAECDRYANTAINVHIASAVAEGGVAGFAGIIALPLDIPAIILLALSTIRQVGSEYGYSEDTEEEKMFVFSILSAAGANTQNEKNEALFVSALIMSMISKQTWKYMSAKAATEKLSLEFAVISLRTLAKQLGINLTKRKALAAIPIIGAVVGASANGWFIREVGIAAQRMFQERWLRDRNLLADGEA